MRFNRENQSSKIVGPFMCSRKSSQRLGNSHCTNQDGEGDGEC